MIDKYANGAVLPAGAIPKPFSRSESSCYWVELAAGEALLLDVQHANTASLQVSTAAADITVALSNYDYRQPDVTTTNDYALQPNPAAVANPTDGTLPQQQFVAPNPDTVWTDIGAPASDFAKVDVSSVSQLRVTAVAATTLHVELTQEVGNRPGYLTDDTAVADTLTDIATLLATPRTDFEPTLVEDTSGSGNYYYAVWEYADDGSAATLVYYDMSGAPVPAPADPVPVLPRDYEVVTTCREAVNAGPGYAVGDRLTTVSFYDAATQTLLGQVTRADATGAVVTPAADDTVPCVAPPSPCYGVECFDVTTGGSVSSVRYKVSKQEAALGNYLCDTATSTVPTAVTVDWGDGTPAVSVPPATAATYTYATAGVYTITVTLTCPDGSQSVLTYANDTTVTDSGTLTGTSGGTATSVKRLTKDDGTHVWYDLLTGAIIAPPAAGTITPCVTASPEHIEQERMWDYLPTGERVEFWRTMVKDSTGTTLSVVDTAVDGLTPYTVAGDDHHTPQRRRLGSEVVNFTAGAAVSLAAVPPFATYAEYHIWGGNIVITTDGALPVDAPGGGIRLSDGTSPELESRDELLGWQAIGQAGQSGAIYVEYFNHALST